MRRRTALVWAAVAVATIAGGGVAVTELGTPASDENTAKNTGVPRSTATVARGDLVSATSVDGTLGYSRERKLNAGASGTLTWITGSGSKVARDGKLYALDGHEVRLMYGAEPMYRELKRGDKGRDVRQLKRNLRELGHNPALADDEEFTAGTEEAVRRWQKKHGLKQTGRIGPGQIAFAPGSVRIQAANAAVADRVGPGQQVLTTTSSERVVELRVKVSEAALAEEGTKVRIELPDGTTAPGTVASVGATATTGDDPGDKTPRVAVTVTFDDPDKVDGIDKSPATVKLTGQTRKNVLSVPVSALLALPDGSFGVQVVEGKRTREVKVTLGMFAQGRVEISGKDLAAGMKVGVASA
ncbi:peptidoglycan-binding protein [Streptomyces sp. O3]